MSDFEKRRKMKKKDRKMSVKTLKELIQSNVELGVRELELEGFRPSSAYAVFMLTENQRAGIMVAKREVLMAEHWPTHRR